MGDNLDSKEIMEKTERLENKEIKENGEHKGKTENRGSKEKIEIKENRVDMGNKEDRENRENRESIAAAGGNVTENAEDEPLRVKFHLPGLRFNYPLNMMILDMLHRYPEYFRENMEIGSFFGDFPTSLWNGGRFTYDDQCDSAFIQQAVHSINAAGVAVRYTYTNPLLTEADLDDPYCNYCMKVADNGKNEVMIVSPILEEYIRKNYPSYKLNSSTCKEIRNVDDLNAELKKDYLMVVLDYNLNSRFDLLEQVEDRGRVEILVNTCCQPDCPRRGEHYRAIAKQQKALLMNRKLPEGKKIPVPAWHCEYGEKNFFYTIQNYPTFISPDAIWEKYVPMGFRNFKIEGRTADLFSLIDTYCQYLMKPERRDEGRLLLTVNLEKRGVIKVGRPRKSRWP